MQEDPPKKRGRKPKSKEDPQDQEEVAEDALLAKKKRGRKPTGKIIDLNKVNAIGGDFASCIIAHIPLSEKDVSKITNEPALLDDGDGPDPGASTAGGVSNSIAININDDIDGTMAPVAALRSAHPDGCHPCTALEATNKELRARIKELEADLQKFALNGKHQYVCNTKLVDVSDGVARWTTKTTTHCWWCCHGFDTVPVGLPERLHDDTFFVQGCFCSFNCAHAYNLSLNDHRVWERYSLMNYMRAKMAGTEQGRPCYITPAPPRQALDVFGGPLTIDEYRDKLQKVNLEFHYLLPPMVPVIGVLEEIPRELTPASVRIHNAHSNLKLKRSKPLPSFNSNLLQLMKKT
jgi:hypothetical protein